MDEKLTKDVAAFLGKYASTETNVAKRVAAIRLMDRVLGIVLPGENFENTVHDEIDGFAFGTINAKPKPWPIEPITAETIKRVFDEMKAFPPVRVRHDGWMRTFLPRKFMVESFGSKSGIPETKSANDAENKADNLRTIIVRVPGSNVAKSVDEITPDVIANSDVEWFEPGRGKRIVSMRMPASMAIAQARKVATLAGKPNAYEFDADALHDFMVIHWARLIDAKGKPYLTAEPLGCPRCGEIKQCRESYDSGAEWMCVGCQLRVTEFIKWKPRADDACAVCGGQRWKHARPDMADAYGHAFQDKPTVCPDCNHSMAEHTQYGCNQGDAEDHPAKWCRCKRKGATVSTADSESVQPTVTAHPAGQAKLGPCPTCYKLPTLCDCLPYRHGRENTVEAQPSDQSTDVPASSDKPTDKPLDASGHTAAWPYGFWRGRGL